MEILLKHQELRVIEQELAKCQVALEQLRRCKLIPYPTENSTPESQLHISNGTGPVLESNKLYKPANPAPWGVTDGPYTRHYAKWLIPDRQFDGSNYEETPVFDYSRAGQEGRSTRNSFPDTAYGNKRPHRGNAGSKLQSLSSGYPPPKEKSGPLIIRRSTDGKMVKLLCIDCGRGDFSSAQGFINHCRIAHKRGFESHDQAALECGQELGADEQAGVVAPAPETKVVAATPTTLVHPLILSAPSNVLPRGNANRTTVPVVKAPKLVEIPDFPGLTKSDKTPNLSKFLNRMKVGVDLQEMVEDAAEMVDYKFSSDEESDSSSEDEDEPVLPTLSKPRDSRLDYPSETGDDRPRSPFLGGVRMPARSGMSPAPLARPSSSKGLDSMNGGRKPTPALGSSLSGMSPRPHYAVPVALSVTPTSHGQSSLNHQHSHDLSMMEPELSPNTIESQNAPSLVSDDDDFSAHSRSESESPSDGGEGDDEDDIVEIDSMLDASGSADEEIPHKNLRRKNTTGESSKKGEERHVGFVKAVKPTRNTKRAAARK
jgi:hypothetical protein